MPTVRPLVWSDLSDEPAPALPSRDGGPSAAGQAVRADLVTIDAEGRASGPFPAGPVLLSVAPELPGPRIVALYEQLAAAGSEPYVVFSAASPLPVGAVHPTEITGWPTPTDPLNDPAVKELWVKPPSAGWTNVLMNCKPGKRLLNASCERRPGRWKAVVAEPRCHLKEPLDGPVLVPTADPLQIAPIRLAASTFPNPVPEDATWSDLSLDPFPPAVVLAGPMAAPPLPEGAVHLHQSEIQPKRKVMPNYPLGAAWAGTVRCAATVDIDTNGIPRGVWVHKCPGAFHAQTREAVLQWRWYPAKWNGQVVPARTTLNVQLKSP